MLNSFTALKSENGLVSNFIYIRGYKVLNVSVILKVQSCIMYHFIHHIPITYP